LGICVGGRASDGLHGGGEASDQTGVDRVGLGELADGVGEAADLQRRDEDDGKVRGERRPYEGLLEAASGFDDDALDTVAAESTNQGDDGVFFVGDGQRSVALKQIEIELALADIDTDVDRGTLLCKRTANPS